jgi:hypothetical protein
VNKNISAKLARLSIQQRELFISDDLAGRYNKVLFEQLGKDLDFLFKFKGNASIYPNLLDDVLNPIHFAIVFELPKLNKKEKITSEIDTKKFSVILVNESMKNQKKIITCLYENRIKILSEIFQWEIVDIDEENWKTLSEEEKIEWLQLKFGVEFKNIEEAQVQVKILEQENELSQVTESKNKKPKPKYNLTKDILSESNKKNKV